MSNRNNPVVLPFVDEAWMIRCDNQNTLDYAYNEGYKEGLKKAADKKAELTKK